MGHPRHGHPVFGLPGHMMRSPGPRGPPGHHRMSGHMGIRPPMPGGPPLRPIGGRGGQWKAKPQRKRSREGEKKAVSNVKDEKKDG